MEGLKFETDAWIVIFVYIVSLLVIGWLGYRARRDNSLQDFYLAGPGFGFAVLILTLYATQYSGNTLFGFTGKAYRTGFSWAMSIHFMTAIIVCYLVLAPRLHRAARANGYITPADYLQDRFGSRAISTLATVLMVLALSNYLLAQLMAMGRALEGLAGPELGPTYYVRGIIILAIVMVIYETLGGLRAVAWTDCIQGLILLFGFAMLIAMVLQKYGPLEGATTAILANPATQAKAAPPSAQTCREWFSYILMVGIGGALYPQAIQRLYAARSAKVLRRSMMVMAFFPLTTTLVALIVGVVALANHPGLEGSGSDKVLTVMLRGIQSDSSLGYWLVVILFAGILAAIMSTADSALLSISSMFTKDLYSRMLRPEAEQKELTRVGKVTSWILVALLVWIAIAMREGKSLIWLLDRKFDLLVQLMPAFFIGLHWKGLKRGPVLGGIIAGLLVAVPLGIGPVIEQTKDYFAFVQKGKVFGIHPGVYGLAANLMVAVGGSLIGRGRNDSMESPSTLKASL